MIAADLKWAYHFLESSWKLKQETRVHERNETEKEKERERERERETKIIFQKRKQENKNMRSNKLKK